MKFPFTRVGKIITPRKNLISVIGLDSGQEGGKLLYCVRKNEKDWIRFTQEIVRFPSFTGEEKAFADYLLDKLKTLGIDETFVDGAGNVVAVIRGTGKGPNIMLNGHLDVVPEGDESNWNYKPFAAEIDDDRNIIGRGVCDLKAGLAAQFFALKVFKEAVDEGLELPGDLVFTAVVHEEAAEMLGMEYLFEKTMDAHDLNCDLVFLCEPSTNDLAIGHRGKVEIVVKTKGQTAHSSQPELGINALEKMIPILESVFAKKGINLKSDPVLGDSSVTVTNCKVSPGALSIVPDGCEISIDRRYMPGEKLEDIVTEFEVIFKEIEKTDSDFKAEVTPRIFNETTYTGYSKDIKKYHPPWVTPRNHEFVVKSFKALRSLGQDPAEKYWKFGTDGSMCAGIYGIPTIGYSGAEEKWAHQPNEKVNIDEMLKTFEGYVAMLCELYDIDISVFETERSRELWTQSN